jgi:hypothetical protein
MTAHFKLWAPIVEKARKHKLKLEATLSELRAIAPAAVLLVALNEPDAQESLRGLRERIADAEFELEYAGAAVDLAASRDAEAEKAWKVSLQDMPAADLVKGITKDSCCGLCRPGTFNGCVLGGGYIGAGVNCWHPEKQKEQFYRDEASGRRKFTFRFHARASEVFDAACKKIGVQFS